MDKNSKYIAAGVLVVVILIGLWAARRPKQTDTNTQNQNMQQDQTPNNVQVTPTTTPTPIPSMNDSSMWQGMLKTSDNAAKGNLMLVTPDHTIYLRTSRDFSSLVGKEVTVNYQGSLENFKLGDIVAK